MKKDIFGILAVVFIISFSVISEKKVVKLADIYFVNCHLLEQEIRGKIIKVESYYDNSFYVGVITVVDKDSNKMIVKWPYKAKIENIIFAGDSISKSKGDGYFFHVRQDGLILHSNLCEHCPAIDSSAFNVPQNLK